MKKQVFTLVLIVASCLNLNAQSLKAHIDSLSVKINISDKNVDHLNSKVNELSQQIEHISYLIEVQKDLISQEQSAIENILNSTSMRLDIFAISDLIPPRLL